MAAGQLRNCLPAAANLVGCLGAFAAGLVGELVLFRIPAFRAAISLEQAGAPHDTWCQSTSAALAARGWFDKSSQRIKTDGALLFCEWWLPVLLHPSTSPAKYENGATDFDAGKELRLLGMLAPRDHKPLTVS